MSPARICAISLAGLVLLRLAYAAAVAPDVRAAAGFAAIALAPLLPFVAAWAFRLRGLWIYGGIAAWVYLAHGAMEAFATPAVRGWALAEIALASIYFVGLWRRSRELKAARAKG